MIRAAFFDLGGVVFMPFQDVSEEWEVRRGIAPGALTRACWDGSDATALIGAVSEEDWYETVVRARLGWSAEELSGWLEDSWARVPVDREVLGLIDEVRRRVRTAYLSNAWSNTRTRLTQREIHGVVDEMFISAEMGVAKPDPKIYAMACEAMGVEPHEALFVDDLEENIESARTFGMHGILHANTPATIAAVRAALLPA